MRRAGRRRLCLQGRVTMTMYVYAMTGDAVGFVFSSFIHDLDGRPLGRILGNRVHRLDGSYVGEFHKNMVVSRPVASRRNLQPIAPPPRQAPADPVARRRGTVDEGYPDVFRLLTVANDEAPDRWSIAAE